MIRPATCICMLLAAGSGLYLYQAKHRSQLLDQEISHTLRKADANRERSRVLGAEYQLLQDPTRMGDLAAQHLALAKTDTKQFASWATVERTIPVMLVPPPAAADSVPSPPAPSAPLFGPPVPSGVALVASARNEGGPARPTAALVAQSSHAVAAASTASSGTSPRPSAVSLATAAGPRSSLGMARSETASAAFAPARSDPVPQQVMLTAPRRPAYPGQFAGGADPLAQLGRTSGLAPSMPISAAGSALGMARMLATPSFLPPSSGSGWVSNGNGG